MADTETNVGVTGRVVSDIILLGLLISTIAVFETGNVTPRETGFFCNDPSIQHPYVPDTINFYVLLVAGLCVTFLVIILVELPHYLKSERNATGSNISFSSIGINNYIVQVYCITMPFLIAAALDFVIVCVFKFSVGRLRPCFLAICSPNLTAETCMQDGHYKFVTTEHTCMDPHLLSAEARMSFPSGHASHAVVCCLYSMLYIQRRMTWRWCRLPRQALQVVALCLPCFIGASRIADYKHYSTDVLGGALIGFFSTLFVLYFFTDLLQQRDAPRSSTNDIRRQDYDRIK